MHELMVTTRLDRAAMDGPPHGAREDTALATSATEVYGLVPLAGADVALPAVAVVCRAGDGARLLALVTHPAVHGRGYGSMLLDGVVNDLRAHGCTTLCVDAASGADGWLLDRGFVRVSATEVALDL